MHSSTLLKFSDFLFIIWLFISLVIEYWDILTLQWRHLTNWCWSFLPSRMPLFLLSCSACSEFLSLCPVSTSEFFLWGFPVCDQYCWQPSRAWPACPLGASTILGSDSNRIHSCLLGGNTRLELYHFDFLFFFEKYWLLTLSFGSLLLFLVLTDKLFYLVCFFVLISHTDSAQWQWLPSHLVCYLKDLPSSGLLFFFSWAIFLVHMLPS